MEGFGGNFNLYGVLTFVFIRSALQLHSNPGVRERKLPTLRTYAEKYIKLMPDLVRTDGLGWAFGRAAGAYGQMHCISLILQGLRDGWIADEQKLKYFDLLRRLFLFFYQTYLDQEHGFLDLRDTERTAYATHDDAPWPTSTPPAIFASGHASPRPCRCPPARPCSTGTCAHLRSLRHLRQEQPKGTGPLHLPRRGKRTALSSSRSSAAAACSRPDSLSFPALSRVSLRLASSTTSICPSCSPELTFGEHVTLLRVLR